MHPIERLRMVARAAGEGPALVAQEAAGALVAFGDDPAGLVTACRRLVDRQPTSGPIWWLAARVLCSSDPTQDAWRAVEELQDDRTPNEVAAALPDGAVVTVVGLGEHIGDALVRRGDLEVLLVDNDTVEPHLIRRLQRTDTVLDAVPAAGVGAAVAASDLVVFEVSAIGPGGMVAPVGSRAAAAVAHHAGLPVWAVAGVGTVLPKRLWEALASRLDEDDEPWLASEEIVPLDLVDNVVGPDGVRDTSRAIAGPTCPVAPELLKEADY
ncbi:MAG: hypothetical protein JO148_15975 [Acidimicrobiia bacterium]|nr:hypothetical protein [Acidimicrobiia bacterium]